MHEIFVQVLQHAVPPAAEFGLISVDALVPIFAIICGVAMAVIQIYNTTRNRAVDLSIRSAEDRLDECERHRDIERAKHEATRNALTEAMTRISGLLAEIKELKAKDAGPQPH